MNEAFTSTIGVQLEGHVAVVEIRKPPHNFFDLPMLSELADTFERLDADRDCRALVLCAAGSSFCAGADFAKNEDVAQAARRGDVNPIYHEAIRLFKTSKPVVAAIHGAAIGGGLGLALVADFRVSCAEARFSANFNRLGFHPGFGLSVTLPRLIGQQNAALLLYTGRRIGGDAALRMGLVDMLASRDETRVHALELAKEIAQSSPLAVTSTRRTLRVGLIEALRVAVARESAEQDRQFATDDFREGITAMAERRLPNFSGR